MAGPCLRPRWVSGIFLPWNSRIQSAEREDTEAPSPDRRPIWGLGEGNNFLAVHPHPPRSGCCHEFNDSDLDEYTIWSGTGRVVMHLETQRFP